MTQEQIQGIVKKQRDFFRSGQTKDLSFRIKQLKNLKKEIIENEKEICDAVQKDMSRIAPETYVCEIAMLINEIDYALKNIPYWTRPEKVQTPVGFFFGQSYIYPEPLGVILIIATWNYPFMLNFTPLVGAIAAGNCALVKPSDVAPASSEVVSRIIEENFEPGFISAVQGGIEETRILLDQKWDYIFFTGSERVGRIVMEAATRNITPLTLELGGKNPCIVDNEVDIKVVARRITWGKFFNAGQTCVAPDYLLVQKEVKNEILEEMKKHSERFYGQDPSKSPYFSRIVNTAHFKRLCRFLEEGNILIGGKTNPDENYIAPTIIDNLSPESLAMKEETFGPILPIVEYETLDEAIAMVNSKPKPLAVYFFSRNREKQKKVLKETSSGGACINDTVYQSGTRTLPFGGVGSSGFGKYHGKAGFDTFTNKKGVLKRPFWIDDPRYPPDYPPLNSFTKWLVRFLSR